MIQPLTPNSTPNSPTQSVSQCFICKKVFKSKRGLMLHEAAIRKYNTYHDDFYLLPEKFVDDFKKTLVFLIHRQLPNHFKKIGMKSFTVACAESQFFATFNGHIHYYSKKTRYYKCIFGGIDASTKLTQIFGDENWGTKFYCKNETTLVVTNLDDIDSEEESPLMLKRKLAVKSPKKSRYKRGEIVFEWRSKQEKDAEDNKCEGGFLYAHFWITKRRIL